MQKIVVALSPMPLILSTAVAFKSFSMLFGADWATLIGFSFYQIVWCIFFPLRVLGKAQFLDMFKEKERLFQQKHALLAALLALSVLGATPIFFYNLETYSIAVFLIGAPLTLINGACEEIFWRGLFFKTFGDNQTLSAFFPTLFFAAWHVSPQLVDADIQCVEMLPLVLLTLPIGLIYGIVAFRTRSIKWVVIAHSLSGALAFGVPLSTSLARILNIALK